MIEALGLIGQWVTDRPAAAEAGLLAWINVDRIGDTLELVRITAAKSSTSHPPTGLAGWQPSAIRRAMCAD
jgi:hypothetical protein